MKLPEKFDKAIIFRFLLSLVLAGAALWLFLYSRGKLSQSPQVVRTEVAEQLGQIDRDVDSVLSRFAIRREWVRKRQFPIPSSSLSRTERRVVIPTSALPIQMNVAFGAMARRYDGRAVASENLKEGPVTIHIEVGGYVIETIILKPDATLGRPRKDRGTKIRSDSPEGTPPSAPPVHS